MSETNFELSLTTNKLTIYSQVEQDESGNNKVVGLNQDKWQGFVDELKPGMFLKNVITIVTKPQTDKQRGFLHGGVIKVLAEKIGTDDREWVKQVLKEHFLKIEFKKDLDGNLIFNEHTKLPIVKESQYFDLTDDEIKSYYSMYKFAPNKILTYPTRKLQKDTERRLLSNILEFLREHHGLVIDAKRVF